jgi:hypothetical protein
MNDLLARAIRDLTALVGAHVMQRAQLDRASIEMTYRK